MTADLPQEKPFFENNKDAAVLLKFQQAAFGFLGKNGGDGTPGDGNARFCYTGLHSADKKFTFTEDVNGYSLVQVNAFTGAEAGCEQVKLRVSYVNLEQVRKHVKKWKASKGS